MDIDQQIKVFLASPAFGVAGASTKRYKYGNKMLRCYQQHGRTVVPINPHETEIEGVACVATISELPEDVKSLSIITPPSVTVQLVKQAIEKGISNIWMQPGAEHPEAVAICHKRGINIIADGSCLLVVLGYNDH
ncbi:MAG: CoA-binding protein [Desulfuromonadales bacterium]|nr:CoA-binding protein [Desulfuromonadales bacterium]